MRSDRLLSLLLILQARGTVTAPVVAAELGVSVRTVYRDVAALSAAGVPVYTEQGYGGGLHLLPGYRTDVTGLTADEARALVALTGRALPEDLGLGASLSTAVHKLVAAVPEQHRDAAEQARQRVLVDHSGWYRTAPAAPLLPALQDVVWADRQVRVRYRHGDGQQGEYRLDPYGLVVKAGIWYLVAARDGEPRLFRVDRMTEAVALEEPSCRPADLDLAALWARLRDEVEAPRDAVRVRLRVRSEALGFLLRVTTSQRSGAGPVREITQGGGECDAGGDCVGDGDAGPWTELELGFRGVRAARGALAGLGALVEVLSPPEVRQDLLRTAHELVALYGPGQDGPTQDGPTQPGSPSRDLLAAQPDHPGDQGKDQPQHE